MKALLYVFMPLFVLGSFLPQQGNDETRNVTVIVHLDDQLSQVEQTVYLHSYLSWVSGGEMNIWDSVRTGKGQKTVELQGLLLLEDNVEITFSKEGPNNLVVYLVPDDTVEIEAFYDDMDQVTYRKALKGKVHNEIIVSDMRSRSMWKTRHRLEDEGKKDSLLLWDSMMVDYYCKEVKQNPHYVPANAARVFLQLNFKDYIGEDSVMALRQYIAKKWPNDVRAIRRTQKKVDNSQSERSLRTRRRISDVKREKAVYQMARKNTEIGKTLSLNLESADGGKVALSDLKGCRYIYVDVWATWCKPCRAQFPYVKQALAKYPQDLKVYAVSIDNNHTGWRESIVKDSLQAFVNVIGTDNNRNQLPEVARLGVKLIPRSFLLDNHCRIVAKDLHGEELIQTLDSLMAQ